MAEGYGGGRSHRRCGKRIGLSTEYSLALYVHIPSGRFRIYGPCRIHHGQAHAQDRPARQVFHTYDNGIRLQCAGDNGHKDHRKQKEPSYHDADHSIDVLCRTNAGLRAYCRSIFPEECLSGGSWTLCSGNPSGCHCRQGYEPFLQGR